ncbi:U100 protein [macacine betaherpesvirus 9]|uniref:U100 protein n=1 Tax=macacine betaherpesvirus 9 TaxID=2560568 RepID=A0A191S3S6_9BETA|nr:U100 protein [macacine betaherpesvirus 9]ANC96523.1 U100 protein [macacine betaherpesvirus 9]
MFRGVLFSILLQMIVNFAFLHNTRPSKTIEEISQDLLKTNGSNHNIDMDFSIELTPEEKSDLLEYTKCNSLSCECHWPDEAQLVIKESVLCVPVRENTIGIRGLKRKIMKKGIGKMLATTVGLHYSLFNGGFGSQKGSLTYMNKLDISKALISISLFPNRHRWQKNKTFRRHSAHCEIIIKAEFKKTRSQSGLALRMQTSLAIVRKDNQGKDWEDCMNFDQWTEEELNIPKINTTSEKALYEACCPTETEIHGNTTYTWRWLEHPWTNTAIEPWKDINIVRHIPADDRCTRESAVFQSIYGQTWCSPKNSTAAKNYLMTIILFPIAMIEIENLFDAIGQKSTEYMFETINDKNNNESEFDPAIVSALWKDLPQKKTFTDFIYDVSMPFSKDSTLCMIKIITDSMKNQFDNGGLVTFNTLFITYLKQEDSISTKSLKNNLLNTHTCKNVQLPKMESCCDEYLRFKDGDIIQFTCEEGNVISQDGGITYCTPIYIRETVEYKPPQKKTHQKPPWIDFNKAVSVEGIKNARINSNYGANEDPTPTPLDIEEFFDYTYESTCDTVNMRYPERKAQKVFASSRDSKKFFKSSKQKINTIFT